MTSVHVPEPTAAAPRPTLGKTEAVERRFRAAPTFGPQWVVMDGFTQMDDEAYPSAGLAEGRADYLNTRGLS